MVPCLIIEHCCEHDATGVKQFCFLMSQHPNCKNVPVTFAAAHQQSLHMDPDPPTGHSLGCILLLNLCNMSQVLLVLHLRTILTMNSLIGHCHSFPRIFWSLWALQMIRHHWETLFLWHTSFFKFMQCSQILMGQMWKWQRQLQSATSSTFPSPRTVHSDFSSCSNHGEWTKTRDALRKCVFELLQQEFCVSNGMLKSLVCTKEMWMPFTCSFQSWWVSSSKGKWFDGIDSRDKSRTMRFVYVRVGIKPFQETVPPGNSLSHPSRPSHLGVVVVWFSLSSSFERLRSYPSSFDVPSQIDS